MIKLQHSLQKGLVDSRKVLCRTASGSGGNGGNGNDTVNYAEPHKPKLITAAEVAAMFGKPPHWFCRDRVRKSLKERGFPDPVIRGRWHRDAVESWLQREGNKCTASDRSVPSKGTSISRK